MTHAIIIRMHYPEGDERFGWRLGYFKDMVLPRLLVQTDQNFDIAIRCRPCHADILRALSPKIKTFEVTGERESHRIIKGKKYFVDFTSWDKVVGLEKYDVQSGLDSDDLVAENYIEMIVKEVEKNDPKKSLHISFQPGMFDARTERKYPMNIKYGIKKGSAFFSIYQPNKEKYLFAYEYSHLHLGRHFDRSVLLPEGYCWASVHGHNISTTLKEYANE